MAHVETHAERMRRRRDMITYGWVMAMMLAALQNRK